jgi:hypothetical protein
MSDNDYLYRHPEIESMCGLGDRCAGQTDPAKGRSLEEYLKLIPEDATCQWCKGPLARKIDVYEHDWGWTVKGFAHKLWLSIACLKCGYEWSLNKLGVLRGVE